MDPVTSPAQLTTDEVKPKQAKLIFTLLRVAVICLFLGRGWQHLFGSTPYDAIFWDQRLMEPLIDLFGASWPAYVESLQAISTIGLIIKVLGGLLVLAGLLLLFAWKRIQVRRWSLLVAGSLLVLFAIAKIKEGHPSWIQFMELAIQVSLPFILAALLRVGFRPSLRRLSQVVVAGTFVGHGLFAAGIYPVPGNFLNMTMSILPLSEEGARSFLWVMGILDFVAAAFILSGSKLGKWGALYAALWGLATALARVLAHAWTVPFFHLLNQWLPETLFRIPHALLPLSLAVWFGLSFRRPALPPDESR